jgi:hypothetical protein
VRGNRVPKPLQHRTECKDTIQDLNKKCSIIRKSSKERNSIRRGFNPQAVGLLQGDVATSVRRIPARRMPKTTDRFEPVPEEEQITKYIEYVSNKITHVYQKLVEIALMLSIQRHANL